MASGFAFHVRRNLIGYLALFVALSGSAYAVTAPRNTVSSKSIRNGQVQSVDLRDNGVAGVDIQDNAVGAADIQDNAVSSPDIQDGGVQGVDLAPGAVGVGNLAPSAIGSPGFAKISSGGTVITSRGVTNVTHPMGTGSYCITTSFTPHVAVATTDEGTGDTTFAMVQIPGGPGGAGCNANEIAVKTLTVSPIADHAEAFYIVIE
jgi:hypothetical protein